MTIILFQLFCPHSAIMMVPSHQDDHKMIINQFDK